MEKDRKTVIADAAIALLASAGAKGLTHRAVDTHAGLPAGSTSAYCRTRQELLTLTLRRHAALDLQDVESDSQRMSEDQWSVDDFVGLLVYRVADWLSPGKRARLVARFELFLIASRDPAFAAIVNEQRQHFLALTEESLHKVGVADPTRLAPMLVALLDALWMDQIRTNGPTLSMSQQRDMLRRLLES